MSAIDHAIYTTNAMKTNQTIGSIGPRAIVISRTRHVSNAMVKYRPKTIQPVKHTIFAACTPPQ
jgi:hypothetical protein